MERQEVIDALESLANGIDPVTRAPISHETFHKVEAVRVLFAAAGLLKAEAARGPAANPKFASAGASWSAEEDARLIAEFDAGMSTAQIALKHARSSGAIHSRLIKLGRMEAPAANMIRAK